MVLKQTKSNYNGSNGNYKVRISRCEAAQQADARGSLSLAVTVLRSRGGLARIANWIIKLFRVFRLPPVRSGCTVFMGQYFSVAGTRSLTAPPVRCSLSASVHMRSQAHIDNGLESLQNNFLGAVVHQEYQI